MTTSYKLMLAIALACCIGPFAFVVWILWELASIRQDSATFEEMAA